MAKPFRNNVFWVLILVLIAATAEAAPPGLSNPSHARCLIKKYKLCYNLEHVCPKFCPDSCHVECVSCKPICGPAAPSPDSESPPEEDGSPPEDSPPGDEGKSPPPQENGDDGKGNGGDGKGDGDDGKGNGGDGKGDGDDGKGNGGDGKGDGDDGKGNGGDGKGDDDDGKGNGGDGKGDGGDGKGNGGDGKGDGGDGKSPPPESSPPKKESPPPTTPASPPPPPTPTTPASPPTPPTPTTPASPPPPPTPTTPASPPTPPTPTTPASPPPPPTPTTPASPPTPPTPTTPASPPTPPTPTTPASPPPPPTPTTPASPPTPPTPTTPASPPTPPTPTTPASPPPPPTPTTPASPPTPPTPLTPSSPSPPPVPVTPSSPSPPPLPPTLTPSPPPPPTIPSQSPPPTPTTPTLPSPPPSPPSDDSSEAAAGQRRRCKNKDFPKCFGSEHVCPSSCPNTCQVDCVTCKPVCKCDMPGAVCQDPRFIGGDGITFYFHGKKDRDFCLVTEPNLHINAHFIGRRNDNMKRDFTWVQSVGILFGNNHRLSLTAKKTATWNDADDRLSLSFDGQPIVLQTSEGSTWKHAAAAATVERDGDTNSVVIRVEGLFEISAKVVPITQHESRVHNYGITEEDCFAHLELGFKFFSLSGSVNGVLGQTYSDNYVSRVKMGVPMPVLGGEREFAVSSLFAADCAVSQFSGGNLLRRGNGGDRVSASDQMPSMKCGSGIGGRGVVCKR